MIALVWKDKRSGETKFVRFDAVSSETHEALVTITSHPVEEGADVVDHARPEPERVSIEGYVSNKPLYANPNVEKSWDYRIVDLKIPKKAGGAPLLTPGGLTTGAIGAITSLIKGPPPTKATVLKASGTAPNRARLMQETLQEARLTSALISVVSTDIQTLDNMMIEALRTPRTLAEGNGLTFQLDLVKVRIVKSQTVSAPVPAEARGAKLVSKGSKSAKEGDAKKDAKMKSIAASLFDGGKGALGSLGF